MISVSGIRGIFGSDLTPENLTTFTAAFGTWAKGGAIVVGRDSRVTGPLCESIICSVLRSIGCDVITVGLASTPTIAMAVLNHQAAGGIIISASHNPAEWNALKLIDGESEFLDADEGQKVIDIADKRTYTYSSYDAIGTLTHDEKALQNHIDEILALPYIDTDLIEKAQFSIALDPVNGAGCTAFPLFLKALGVNDIYAINDEPTGLFAHNPEPLPEHLTELCDLVRQKNCDLGISVDPDADRLALITDTGKPFGEEYTQAAAFDFMLARQKGTCATNLSSSRIVEDVAQKHDSVCHRSAVGEINVVKKMKEQNAIIGGEGNGGVINPDLHYGRDAFVGTAMILQLLAEREVTLSEYRSSLPDYAICKSKLPLEDLDADGLLEQAATQYAQYSPNTLDGVKIDFPEGWVHLRKSNTEPILRIYSEAVTPEEARKLADSVTKKLTS